MICTVRWSSYKSKVTRSSKAVSAITWAAIKRRAITGSSTCSGGFSPSHTWVTSPSGDYRGITVSAEREDFEMKVR